MQDSSDRISRRHTVFGVVVLSIALSSCTGGSDTGTGSTTTVTTASETSITTEAPATTAQGAGANTTTSETIDPNGDPWAIDFPSEDSEGVLLGFSTGLSRTERAPRWEQLETDAGRMYDIGHVFHSWNLAIPTADDLMHIENGRLLMISWNGTDTRQIVAGVHDDWIRSQARGVASLERRVLLRWLWEMDAPRRRAWVHSGEDYIAAWNHIRAIFVEEGATNAEFVWCPNEFLFWDDGDPTPWYPGDENVDWLCADGYNWATTTASDEWVDFVDIFGDFYAWAAPRDKPIIIGETGSNEGEPGAKAAWIRSLPELLRTELPEIDAVAYFDKDFRFQNHPDWRFDTSPESYEAWIEISTDAWLNPFDR